MRTNKGKGPSSMWGGKRSRQEKSTKGLENKFWTGGEVNRKNGGGGMAHHKVTNGADGKT